LDNCQNEGNSISSQPILNQETDFEVAFSTRVLGSEMRNLDFAVAQSELQNNLKQNFSQEIENFSI